MDTEGSRGGRDARGQGRCQHSGGASPHLCQTLSSPAPPPVPLMVPHTLSPGLPLPSLSPKPPAVLHVDHTPRTLSGTSDSTEAPPGPITAPSSVSAAALCSLAAWSCWHPGTQRSSPGLCWRAPAGLSALPLAACLPSSLCSGHGQGSCHPPLLPAPRLVLLSLESRPLQAHLPPPSTVCPAWRLSLTRPHPPPQMCARVTQAPVWLPLSVDTEAVRLKRFVSSIHERYRGTDRAGAETASDPSALSAPALPGEGLDWAWCCYLCGRRQGIAARLTLCADEQRLFAERGEGRAGPRALLSSQS